MTNKKKIRQVMFDLWISVSNTSRIVGCFSVNEDQLEDVSAKSIYKYIVDNFDKFLPEKRWEFDYLYHTCWGFDIPHIETKSGNALIVANIHYL